MKPEDEFPNPNNIYTKEEIEGILEYRRTGKIPDMPYEELDFNNVGGVINEINSEITYKIVLERLDEIFDAKPNTPQGEEFEKLTKLILEWENKNYPI